MIFFDLDGTLLDHKSSEYAGVKEFYKEYKEYFKLEQEVFYKYWGRLSDKHFNRYLSGEITFKEQRVERIKELFMLPGIELSDEVAESIFSNYLAIYQDNWTPFRDVIPCLQQISRHKLGIISNGDFMQQSLKLEKMGIKKYFQIIITSGEIGIAKPNTMLFDIACKKVNEFPQNCYYIGDDLKLDILPCNEIGMKGIWINRKNGQTDIDGVKTISSLEDLKI